MEFVPSLSLLHSQAKGKPHAQGFWKMDSESTHTVFYDRGLAVMGNQSNIGFSQMAAALMAAEHFNSRDSSVVPELAELGDCQIAIEIPNTSVFDTVPLSHIASQNLVARGVTPCAVVGPSTDEVAWELSAVAQAAQYPIVFSRNYNLRLAYDEYASFSASVFPDVASTAEALAAYLEFSNRTDYIALLFERTDTGRQRREILDLLYENKVNFVSAGYDDLDLDISIDGVTPRSILEAMKEIKESGYRTIVIAMHNPLRSFQAIADVVEELDMNNGNYFYVWYDMIAIFPNWDANVNVSKLAAGSAWTFPLENHLLDEDTFLSSWTQQGSDLVDRVNVANPIEPGQIGYQFADPDYFQTFPPEIGAGEFVWYQIFRCVMESGSHSTIPVGQVISMMRS